MTRVAVTGGAGRIGAAVISLALRQGHDVVSIIRSGGEQAEKELNIERRTADLSDFAATRDAIAGCEALVHMAAIPSPAKYPPQVVHNNNVVSTFNVLQAAAALGIKRVCLASSVNAVGAAYSRRPRYDYFPLDEEHPTYNEDPYALSKWIGEQQADSFARRYEDMRIASLRFHWSIATRPSLALDSPQVRNQGARDLWGFSLLESNARAALLALEADFTGHEVFYIVAPTTYLDVPSIQMQQEFYPEVPLRGDFSTNRSFYDCSKAERLLGWKHDE